jgi:hypothetical protein
MRGGEFDGACRREHLARQTVVDGWVVGHAERLPGKRRALLEDERGRAPRDGSAHSRRLRRARVTSDRAGYEPTRIQRTVSNRPDASEHADAARSRVDAFEFAPTASGLNAAMLIAHCGVGCMLAAKPRPDAGDDTWRSTAVVPSWWSCLRADHASHDGQRHSASTTPPIAGCIRVTGSLQFAASAARIRACSVRDAIWLAERTRERSFTSAEPPIHPIHERDKDIP